MGVVYIPIIQYFVVMLYYSLKHFRWICYLISQNFFKIYNQQRCFWSSVSQLNWWIHFSILVFRALVNGRLNYIFVKQHTLFTLHYFDRAFSCRHMWFKIETTQNRFFRIHNISLTLFIKTNKTGKHPWKKSRWLLFKIKPNSRNNEW